VSYHEIAATAARTFRRQGVRLVEGNQAQDLIDLVDMCSAESRFQRFHTGMPALRPAMAEQLATTASLGLRDRRGRLVADARYMPTRTGEAELAVLIADDYQGRGLGAALLAVLFQKAADEGREALSAEVLASNEAVIALLSKLAPVETVGHEQGARRLRIPLRTVELAA